MSNILIVTPVYPPAIGGGSFYTQLIANGLLDTGKVNSVVVLTEQYPNQPNHEILRNGTLHIIRLFPYRAGEAEIGWQSYLKYFYQNLQFFWISNIVVRFNITHCLIHTYFYINISSIHLVVKGLRLFHNDLKLIADVRDPKLPIKKFKMLCPYDAIICCSQSVYNHLSQEYILDRNKFHLIPIPIDIKIPSSEFVQSCRDKYNLSKIKYVFHSNGISNSKRADLAVDLVRELRANGEDLILVVAGKNRDWNNDYQLAVDSGIMQYIGPISNNEVLALCKGAEIVINLSAVEGMPRSCLEAIAVGARVLLPPNVPEFHDKCPKNVAISENPRELAEQILKILNHTNQGITYEIDLHSTIRIIPEYLELLNEQPRCKGTGHPDGSADHPR